MGSFYTSPQAFEVAGTLGLADELFGEAPQAAAPVPTLPIPEMRRAEPRLHSLALDGARYADPMRWGSDAAPEEPEDPYANGQNPRDVLLAQQEALAGLQRDIRDQDQMFEDVSFRARIHIDGQHLKKTIFEDGERSRDPEQLHLNAALYRAHLRDDGLYKTNADYKAFRKDHKADWGIGNGETVEEVKERWEATLAEFDSLPGRLEALGADSRLQRELSLRQREVRRHTKDPLHKRVAWLENLQRNLASKPWPEASTATPAAALPTEIEAVAPEAPEVIPEVISEAPELVPAPIPAEVRPAPAAIDAERAARKEITALLLHPKVATILGTLPAEKIGALEALSAPDLVVALEQLRDSVPTTPPPSELPADTAQETTEPAATDSVKPLEPADEPKAPRTLTCERRPLVDGSQVVIVRLEEDPQVLKKKAIDFLITYTGVAPETVRDLDFPKLQKLIREYNEVHARQASNDLAKKFPVAPSARAVQKNIRGSMTWQESK